VEASQAITPATSPGAATWTRVRLPATWSRTAAVTQPVSVTGGWTMLAVTPNGASSTAADIV
jgi:hypothetical protein